MLTTGTRGDVQPYVALGRGLASSGHTVCLATGPEHEEYVRGAGMAFAPVRGRLLSLLPSSGARQDALLGEQLRDCWAAVQGSDAVLGGYTIIGAGSATAEKLCVPFLRCVVLPLAPTSAFPHPVFPPALMPVHSGLYNRLTYRIVPVVARQRRLRAALQRARRTVLDLPPLPLQRWARGGDATGYPTLYGYSASVLPKPPDWDADQHVTGYWFNPPPADGHLAPALEAFLAAGAPPVYVSFGSRAVAGLSAAALVACVHTALRQAGCRGIVALDPAEVENPAPADLYLDPHTPHALLFPRMAAVVHHGGAGSTAATLRASLPAVVIPAGFDQPFWAWRVRELGVGVRGPRWGDGAKLGAALRQVLRDGGMRARAAGLGERIRAEDGVGQAVAVIERTLGG